VADQLLCSYHPMDAVTKPNAPATIAAQVKTPIKRSSTETSTSTLKDEGSTPEFTSDEKPQPPYITKASVSNLQHVAIPELPEYKSRTPSPVKNLTPVRPIPVTSTKKSSDKKPIKSWSRLLADRELDLEDEAETPPPLVKAPAKTSEEPTQTPVMKKNSSKKPTKILSRLLVYPVSDLEDEANTAVPPPSWSNLQNPYLNQRAMDPEKLCSLDRILYQFQKGAPLHSTIVPHKWQEAKQLLFDHGEITLDELNDSEATKWLKARYEDLRTGIEAFFGSRPEPSTKQDWPLVHSEGFDVFDMKSGVKYWKHRKYSIVNPVTTITSNMQRREIPESGDDVETLRDETETKQEAVEDDFTADRVLAFSESDFKASYHSEVEASMTTVVDLEGFDGIDHEKTLVESMRGGDLLTSHIMMGIEDLGELLSPAEQCFAEIPTKQDVGTGGTLSGSNTAVSAGFNGSKATPTAVVEARVQVSPSSGTSSIVSPIFLAEGTQVNLRHLIQFPYCCLPSRPLAGP